MPALIRPFSAEDLQRLVGKVSSEAFAHHKERLAWHTQGVALYLVAWRGDVPVGRATLLWQSKYAEVRQRISACCEINALEARPTGNGTGAALMAAAEDAARSRGLPVLGVAVEPSNVGARRFYDRIGYREWEEGKVCDEWDEFDQDRVLVRHHADECRYLRKDL